MLLWFPHWPSCRVIISLGMLKDFFFADLEIICNYFGEQIKLFSTDAFFFLRNYKQNLKIQRHFGL